MSEKSKLPGWLVGLGALARLATKEEPNTPVATPHNPDEFLEALKGYDWHGFVRNSQYSIFTFPDAENYGDVAAVVVSNKIGRSAEGRYPLKLEQGTVKGFDDDNARGKKLIVMDREYDAWRRDTAVSQAQPYDPLDIVYVCRWPDPRFWRQSDNGRVKSPV